jgi:hypothetical protein
MVGFLSRPVESEMAGGTPRHGGKSPMDGMVEEIGHRRYGEAHVTFSHD